jgi:hypothetical protein
VRNLLGKLRGLLGYDKTGRFWIVVNQALRPVGVEAPSGVCEVGGRAGEEVWGGVVACRACLGSRYGSMELLSVEAW